MKITPESHPYCYKALSLVAHDNGMVNRMETIESHMDIPQSHVPFLPLAEAELAKLTEEELDVLCTGDHDSIIDLQDKYGLTDSFTLIGDFFNGWLPDPDSEDCCHFPD